MTYAQTLKSKLAEFDERWQNLETWDKHFTKPGNAKPAVKQFLTSFAEEIAQSVREEDTDYIRTKFLLTDWSGEAEVYEELLRLACEIEFLTTLATLKK